MATERGENVDKRIATTTKKKELVMHFEKTISLFDLSGSIAWGIDVGG